MTATSRVSLAGCTRAEARERVRALLVSYVDDREREQRTRLLADGDVDVDDLDSFLRAWRASADAQVEFMLLRFDTLTDGSRS